MKRRIKPKAAATGNKKPFRPVRRRVGSGKRIRRSLAAKPSVRRSAAGIRSEAAWKQWGLRTGEQDAGLYSIAEEGYQKKALNRYWMERMRQTKLARASWTCYVAAAKGYLEGYGRKSGIATCEWMLIPTEKTVAAVLSVMNEEATVMEVLHQLHRLPLDEIIVVVNGSMDQTFQRVRQGSHAIVVNNPEPLGYDVGRAVGTKLATSDMVLFMDGDIPISAEQLLPFMAAIDRGTDVALNNIYPYLDEFSKWDSVSIVKQFLNRSIGRPDLGVNSLTAVPHALSRRALTEVGTDALMIPPKAQLMAIMKGLKVEAPWSVDVISLNRVNEYNAGKHNPVAEMIIGDHVEALGLAQELLGDRMAFSDKIRKRHYIN